MIGPSASQINKEQTELLLPKCFYFCFFPPFSANSPDFWLSAVSENFKPHCLAPQSFHGQSLGSHFLLLLMLALNKCQKFETSVSQFNWCPPSIYQPTKVKVNDTYLTAWYFFFLSWCCNSSAIHLTIWHASNFTQRIVWQLIFSNPSCISSEPRLQFSNFSYTRFSN